MSFYFAHISDLHLPPLPAVALRELVNKRLLGWLSWHRKRKGRHRPPAVAALERALDGRGLDHICISGDVTNLGLAREFQAADRWLQGRAGPGAVTFVPGNHDAYIAASLDEMRAHFNRWLPDRFPSVTRRDGVMFIGVSSAVATPPFMATGRVGGEQLERLASILDGADAQPVFRVLVIHHPPIRGVVGRRKGLTDAGALQDMLRERSVDLILHGHGHHAVHYELECGGRPVPVFGAGSASLCHRESSRSGHFHIFELSDDELGVWHYRYRPDRDRFEPAGESSIPRRLGAR